MSRQALQICHLCWRKSSRICVQNSNTTFNSRFIQYSLSSYYVTHRYGVNTAPNFATRNRDAPSNHSPPVCPLEICNILHGKSIPKASFLPDNLIVHVTESLRPDNTPTNLEPSFISLQHLVEPPAYVHSGQPECLHDY